MKTTGSEGPSSTNNPSGDGPWKSRNDPTTNEPSGGDHSSVSSHLPDSDPSSGRGSSSDAPSSKNPDDSSTDDPEDPPASSREGTSATRSRNYAKSSPPGEPSTETPSNDSADSYSGSSPIKGLSGDDSPMTGSPSSEPPRNGPPNGGGKDPSNIIASILGGETSNDASSDSQKETPATAIVSAFKGTGDDEGDGTPGIMNAQNSIYDTNNGDAQSRSGVPGAATSGADRSSIAMPPGPTVQATSAAQPRTSSQLNANHMLSGGSSTVNGEVTAHGPEHNGKLIIGGTRTLTQGQAATIGDTPVSFGTFGLVVGHSTVITDLVGGGLISLSNAAIINDGSQSFAVTDKSGVVKIGLQTLSVGGPAIVTAGETLSLGPTGIAVAIAGSTSVHLLSAISGAQGKDTFSDAVVHIGSQSFTVIDSSGAVSIGSHLLSVGGPAFTSAGETISLAPSGIKVEDAGVESIVPFSKADDESTRSSNVQVAVQFSILGHHFTAYEAGCSPSTALIPEADGDPITLSIGGPATELDGQLVSLGIQGLHIGTGTSSAGWSTFIETGTSPAKPSDTTNASLRAAQTANESGAGLLGETNGWHLCILGIVYGVLAVFRTLDML
ncbi:MAG: hypothetical protein M1821_000584 [Bathelium mastoideum]|nr:MAG: hypothetical protein M1821_000584 [Bathelium mastoideum]